MLGADNEVAGLRGEQAGAVCKTRAAYSAAPALPRKYCYQAWQGAIGMSSEHGQWPSGSWACGLGEAEGSFLVLIHSGKALGTQWLHRHP